MTDDELHRAWIDGQSLDAIAASLGVARETVAGRVRRLRQKEGLARWPYRDIKRRTDAPPEPPKRLKPGTSTLPPLASLEGHGAPPRR